jgi:Family of unknown function (DUF6279)
MFIKNRYISIVYKSYLSIVGNLNIGVLRLWLPLVMSCLVATSCSTVLFGYDAVPPLAKFQLNRYFDLSSNQQDVVERQLEDIFDWHRKTQLKEYSSFINQITDKVKANEPIAVVDIQRWRSVSVGAWLPVANKVSRPFTELALTLTPGQIEHMKKRFAKTNADMRDDYVKANEKGGANNVQVGQLARQKARATRIEKRAEFFFDDLTEAQLKLISKRAAQSPDAELAWYNERVRRQQDFVAMLEVMRANKMDVNQSEPLMREYLKAMWEPKDEKNARLIIESAKASDETIAQIYAIASSEQKAYAVKKLRGYSTDFDKLGKRYISDAR